MKNLTKEQLFVLNDFMKKSNFSCFKDDAAEKYFTLRLAMSKEVEDMRKAAEILKEETKPEALKKEGAEETEELKKEWMKLHDESFAKSVALKESDTNTHVFSRSEALKYVSCNSGNIVSEQAEWILSVLAKEE